MSHGVFVTGGNGFIGRHVVESLRSSGLPQRVLLSRPHPSFAERFPGVDTVHGDLLDLEVLDRGMAGVSTVIHLASKNIDHDGSGFERVNVEGARRVAERAVAAGVRRLIYVSSVGVYGHGEHRLADETTARHPDTPFSKSKAAAEDVFLDLHRRGEVECVILRHRFVYGDGDQAVMPRLIKAARKYPFWIAGGRATMSLIWAADLAHVMTRLAAGDGDVDGEHPTYHVTDGQPIAYRQVITTLCDAFGWQPPRFSVPLPLLYVPVRCRELLLGIDPEVSAGSITSIRLKLVAQDNSFANDKLRRLLPDVQFRPFAQGLAASLDYYRSQAVAEPTP